MGARMGGDVRIMEVSAGGTVYGIQHIWFWLE